MTVTIHSDASYSRTRRLGAYAYYVISDQGRMSMCGPLPKVASSADAAMMALLKALIAVETRAFTEVTEIIIYTGREAAYGKMTWKAAAGTFEAACFQTIQRLKRTYPGVRYLFRRFQPGQETVEVEAAWCRTAAVDLLRR